MRLALPLLAFVIGCGGHGFFDPYQFGDGGSGGRQDGTSVVSSSVGSGGGGAEGGGGAKPTTDSTLTELDLGTVPIDQPVTFNVPSDAIGATAIVYSPAPLGRVGVKRLRSPNQQVVLDDHMIAPASWVFSWFGTTVAGIPQSDAASVMPKLVSGTWQLTLGNPKGNDTEANVSVWFRRTPDGQFHGGTLDVNVSIAGNSAPSHYVDDVLALAFTNYAGLNLGDVTYYQLGAAWESIDEGSFLALQELSAMATKAPALNLFVVNALTGNFDMAAGVAAGIPGQGIDHGSHSSGIVWLATGDKNLDALIIKHETGHLSGLFHTTEIEKGAFDTLGDTVTCDDVEGKLFACADATNVMFPVAGPKAIDLTPMQQRVIQGTTLYRGQLVAAPNSGGLQPPPTGSPAQSAAASWSRGLPKRAHDLLLRSHWCVRSGIRAARLLRRLAPRQIWIKLASDLQAPRWVRARARRAVGLGSER